MVRSYLKNDLTTQDAPQEAVEQTSTGQDSRKNPLRELQKQYARILTTCYELYAEGKRCMFEEDSLKLFDCSNCEHRDADRFCRSNFFLKKLVKLIAEHFVRRNSNPSSAQISTDEERIPCASFTPEQIKDFKRKGVSYEIETPFCVEHVWFVPERTDKDRVEFTPEEMNFLIQTADAVEGKFIKIGTPRSTPDTRNTKDAGEDE